MRVLEGQKFVLLFKEGERSDDGDDERSMCINDAYIYLKLRYAVIGTETVCVCYSHHLLTYLFTYTKTPFSSYTHDNNSNNLTKGILFETRTPMG